MQTYNIISMSPYIGSFPTCISSSCVGSALKDIVKIYHRFKIEELILADQMNHWKARMNYYKENGRSKVNIGYDVVPSGYLNVKRNGQSVAAIGLTPMKPSIVTPYVTPIIAPVVSNTLTESSVMTPFVPSVYYTSNPLSKINLTGV